MALEVEMNESRIVRLAQEGRKVSGGFASAEIKDCETKNMTTVCH